MTSLFLGLIAPVLALAAASASGPILVCADPGNARVGAPLVFTCTVAPADAAVAVVLYRRQGGQEQYQPEPGLKVGPGTFRISICGGSLQPGQLQIYAEARDAHDRVAAHSADDFSPQLLFVAGAAPAPAPAPSPALAVEEDPLAAVRAEQAAVRARADAGLRRAEGRLYLGLGVGYGYGFFPDRRLDLRSDIAIDANGGPSGVVVLAPELGYQMTARWAMGFRGRWEWIGHGQGAGDNRGGTPADQSWALLLRISRAFGGGKSQLVVSGSLGGGDGFRVVVPPVPEQGLRHNDTVRGGALLVGPGVAAVHHLSPHLALVVSLNALAGLPHVAGVFDLQGGVEIGL